MPMWVRHWKFLRFIWQETLVEFACLPFGLASAPKGFLQNHRFTVGSL